MVGAPETGSQVRWSSGSRNSGAQRGGGASVAPHRLPRLALCLNVSASLLSAAGVAVSPDATPSFQPPGGRMPAPIGHRQPLPSDLPPSVQRDERLDPHSARTQPQNQTPNRRAPAGSAPTIDARKGCEASQEALGSIFGPNNAFGVETCLRQEQEARQQIINNWTTYPASDRQKCINTTVYNPSYVEWITCLEMYRDVRSLNRTVGAGTR